MENSRKSKSADLSEWVAKQLSPMLPPHSAVLVGLSGGVDSVVLLHLLYRLAPNFSWRISALHIHHGISPNADAWANFCAALCAGLGIPLSIERVDIAPLREHGIEAAARKLRHAAFGRQSCDFIALAHHADDQAETLLLQLLRGAGVRGAAAMPLLATARPGGASLVRPLLSCSRREILDYAAVHRLHWIEDESNEDERYPRNFLRHRVLPLLQERFPACRETLSRGAQHFAEAIGLLDELAQQDGAPAIQTVWLDVLLLRTLSPPRARNVVRYYLHRCGAPMPQAAQLGDILSQLCDARRDAAVCVNFGGWQIRRYQDRAYALPALGGFDRDLVAIWRGETELEWPALRTRLKLARVQGAGISAEKLRAMPVTLRLRNGSVSLRPHAQAATRSLKNLLQEHRIPPWQRERLPLLYCGNELVCVPGVATAATYQAGPHEAGILLSLE
ncbi:MAG: tRNA lysidine(34) synthetase TilS [Gallionella sp.]|nr:tRNA lysidine(34) synthetase TilS [Gallionella sp.]